MRQVWWVSTASSSRSVTLNCPGDPDLTALSGRNTYDATTLEFDFIPTDSTLYMQYVFSSEEYNQWIGKLQLMFSRSIWIMSTQPPSEWNVCQRQQREPLHEPGVFHRQYQSKHAGVFRHAALGQSHHRDERVDESVERCPCRGAEHNTPHEARDLPTSMMPCTIPMFSYGPEVSRRGNSHPHAHPDGHLHARPLPDVHPHTDALSGYPPLAESFRSRHGGARYP